MQRSPSYPFLSLLPAMKTLSEQPDKQHRLSLTVLSSAAVPATQGLTHRKPSASTPSSCTSSQGVGQHELPHPLCHSSDSVGGRGWYHAALAWLVPHLTLHIPALRKKSSVTQRPGFPSSPTLYWKPVWLCSCCQTVPLFLLTRTRGKRKQGYHGRKKLPMDLGHCSGPSYSGKVLQKWGAWAGTCGCYWPYTRWETQGQIWVCKLFGAYGAYVA